MIFTHKHLLSDKYVVLTIQITSNESLAGWNFKCKHFKSLRASAFLISPKCSKEQTLLMTFNTWQWLENILFKKFRSQCCFLVSSATKKNVLNTFSLYVYTVLNINMLLSDVKILFFLSNWLFSRFSVMSIKVLSNQAKSN